MEHLTLNIYIFVTQTGKFAVGGANTGEEVCHLKMFKLVQKISSWSKVSCLKFMHKFLVSSEISQRLYHIYTKTMLVHWLFVSDEHRVKKPSWGQICISETKWIFSFCSIWRHHELNCCLSYYLLYINKGTKHKICKYVITNWVQTLLTWNDLKTWCMHNCILKYHSNNNSLNPTFTKN